MIAVIRVERNRSKTENVSSTPCFSQNYMLHSNAGKKNKKIKLPGPHDAVEGKKRGSFKRRV